MMERILALSPVASEPNHRAPFWIFFLQLGYLTLLVGIGLLNIHSGPFRNVVPNPAGPIPLAIPWWGALGGISISFTGIFRNSDSWNTRYELWHIARPFIGAIVGSVAYLIFIILIRAAVTNPPYLSPTNGAIFDLVAFLTGYREEVFRELLKRATDSLFSPAKHDNGQQ